MDVTHCPGCFRETFVAVRAIGFVGAAGEENLFAQQQIVGAENPLVSCVPRHVHHRFSSVRTYALVKIPACHGTSCSVEQRRTTTERVQLTTCALVLPRKRRLLQPSLTAAWCRPRARWPGPLTLARVLIFFQTTRTNNSPQSGCPRTGWQAAAAADRPVALVRATMIDRVAPENYCFRSS